MLRMTLALVLVTQLAVAGPLYRWVDDDGKVHYSDQPPALQDSENLQFEFLGSGADQSKADGRTPAESEEGGKSVNSELQLRELDEALALKPSAARCAAARQRLQLYQEARQIERPDEYGRRTVLSDTERQSAIDGAEQGVKRACAGEASRP